MIDGTWDMDNEDDFFSEESYFHETAIHEAMLGAYRFLLSPKWIALKKLGFEPKVQVALVDTMIQYFSDLEEYEKCAKLVVVKDKIKLRYLIGVLDNPKSAHSASGSDNSRMTDDI